MRILPLGPRESFLGRARKRLQRVLHQPKTPLEFMEAVVVAEREQRFADAAQYCRRGLARFPDDYYLLMKGLSYARDACDRAAAVALLTRADSACPETAATLASVGEEHAFLGQMEQAESFFRRALARMPANPEIREKLAMALVQQRKMDEGISELSQAMKQEPGNRVRRDLLAQVLMHAERHREAVELLTADPDEALSWDALMCLSVARSRLEGGHEFADAVLHPGAPEDPERGGLVEIAGQGIAE